MNHQGLKGRIIERLLLNRHMVILLLTFAAFAAILGLYFRAEEAVDLAHLQRFNSFRLGDELRQSSDDLTRMVRTYVVTGDSAYKTYYQDILDIRNGKKPRPLNYGDIYWDLIIAPTRMNDPAGPPVALLDLMLQANFTSAEFVKLS